MREVYILLVVSLVFNICLFAQFNDGSIAPDFEVMDINGNTHRLYDYLDEDKIVMLDFFSTNCPPCWDYHKSGMMNLLDRKLGNLGTEEVVIISIESLASTNLACIYDRPDCNSTTYGDWTEGVTWPIVDDHEIFSLLKVSFTPTQVFIHPDRRMYSNSSPDWDEILELLNFKVELQDGLNVELYENYSTRTFNCAQASLNGKIKLMNVGTEAFKTMGINFYVADTLFDNQYWLGNAEPYEMVTFQTQNWLILSDDTKLKLEVYEINADRQTWISEDSEHIRYYTDKILVNVDPSLMEQETELLCQIFQEESLVEDFLWTDNSTASNVELYLEPGCYEIKVESTELVPKNCLTIKDKLGRSLFDKSVFGKESVDFETSSLTGLDESEGFELSELVSFKLFPNPSSDFFSLQMVSGLNQSFSYKIYNNNGDCLRSSELNISNYLSKIPISELSPGAYFIKVFSSDQVFVRSFVKI